MYINLAFRLPWPIKPTSMGHKHAEVQNMNFYSFVLCCCLALLILIQFACMLCTYITEEECLY